jgi:hypothetical protein
MSSLFAQKLNKFKDAVSFVKFLKLQALFPVDEMLVPLVRQGKFDLAFDFAQPRKELHATLVNMTGVDCNNPTLANKYCIASVVFVLQS